MCPWEWVAEAGLKGEIIGSRGQENVRLGVGWITAWMWRLKSTSSGMSKDSDGGEDRRSARKELKSSVIEMSDQVSGRG